MDEIEAKFRIEDKKVFVWLTTLSRLDSYILHSPFPPEAQDNTYYDTDDRRLEAAVYGLRIRKIGERCIATLKGQGTVDNGIFQRPEWEEALSSCNPDPRTWPESELRSHVLNLIGDAQVVPLLTIQTNRQLRMITYQEREIAEMCLDESVITAGNQTETFQELEVELLPDGNITLLQSFLLTLTSHIALVPENRSKLERGLALLRKEAQEDVD